MRRWGVLLAGLLASPAAVAADMPGTWLPPLNPPLSAVRSASPWYLRGDIGYGWFRADRAVSVPGFPDPKDNSFDGTPVAGIGIGYQSNWLRTDVTIDYSDTKYRGTIVAPGDAGMKVRAITGLFNGYLDLGAWYGLMPYLGAGAGVSYIRTTDSFAPPLTAGVSNTQWKFAWALMAGAAYAVTPNIAVDVGYRYLNLGDVSTASDPLGAMTLKNLAAHEVRVGFRWSFENALLPY